MLTITLRVPADLTDSVLGLVEDDDAVSGLAVQRGASLKPVGDVITVDVAREAANDLLQRLHEADVGKRGTILVQPVDTWISQAGLDSERLSPGAGPDAVVWVDVVRRSQDDSELTWTYGSLMCLATVLAAVAIVLDSQILVIGAMMLGPEFGAVAAIGVGILRKRWGLLRHAVVTLLAGFVMAMAVTLLLALAAKGLGWITVDDLVSARPGTGFIYSPDKWSFIVGMIAASAGVLTLTSSKREGISGVFVSVTTIPAAANVSLALAFGVWHEVTGSLAQLTMNLAGMGLAGWLTLVIQQTVWQRVRKTWRARVTQTR